MQSFSEAGIKSGLVAIVGPPNAGKSTLMNSLLGQKISIVTPKPQTTRNRILGIMNDPAYQIVLLDTPGLHQARQPLNLEMVKVAMNSLTEVDVILFLVDLSLPLPGKDAAKAKQYLEGTSAPAVLLLNKIDLLADRQGLLPIIESYRAIFPFKALIPVSALTKEGLALLLQELLALLPVGPRYYPEDIPTAATERFIVSEIIREKIFLLTDQEIPYSTAVMVDSFKEDEKKGLVTIHATIFIEKSSQKGIIIGKKGAKLEKIGTSARQNIEALLARRVMLKLFVKVKKNWTRDLKFIRELDIA